MSAKVGGPESLHFEEVPARIESNLEVLGVGEDFGFQKTQETTQMWTANQKRMERFWRSLGRLTIGPGAKHLLHSSHSRGGTKPHDNGNSRTNSKINESS